MIDVEPLIEDAFSRFYPIPSPEPAWAEVLASAGVRRPGPRRGRVAVAAASAVAVTAVILLALSPWTVSPSFADRSLAAVGNGRWVFAVIQTRAAYTRVVDLATGREAPVMLQTMVAYDAGTQRLISWSYNLPNRATGAGPEPELSGFLDGYRSALRPGAARRVGAATFKGRPVTLLRFPTGPTAAEVVAVDDRTHRPVWFRAIENGRQEATYLVLRILSLEKRPPVPKALPVSDYIDGRIAKIRSLTPVEASRALGRTARWVGPSIGDVTLRSVELDRVTKVRLRHFVAVDHSLGVAFSYQGANDWLEVSEELRPYAYEFYAYPGKPVFAADGLLPPEGRASLSCDACGPGNHSPQYHLIWRAQLQIDGLYVRIRSTNRALVIAAARGLKPAP
jgi:hypothetical protein